MDKLFDKFLENCVAIWQMIISTEETDTQKSVKDWFRSFSLILGNIFFVCVTLLLVTWGLQTLYSSGKDIFDFLGNSIGKYAAAIVYLIIGTLFLISLTVKLLLYVYKWVRLVDLFKLYVYIELLGLFLNFSKADQDKRGPLLVQMFNKVFNTHFFEPKKADTPNTIVYPGLRVVPKRVYVDSNLLVKPATNK